MRRHLGGGSPNTVSAHLDEWFVRLPARLVGAGVSGSKAAVDGPPLAVIQAGAQFWAVARREADQAQLQVSEAVRCALELERAALAEKEAGLKQRETAFDHTRAKLDEALAAAQQAPAAMRTQSGH